MAASDWTARGLSPLPVTATTQEGLTTVSVAGSASGTAAVAGAADVNVLLYLLWCASEGRVLSSEEVAGIDAACEGWRRAVVGPLRQVRRGLKTPALVEPRLAEAYRAKIKASLK